MDAVAILESSTFAIVGGLGKLLNSRNSIFALTCLICWMKLPQIEIWYISNLVCECIRLSHPPSPIYVCVAQKKKKKNTKTIFTHLIEICKHFNCAWMSHTFLQCNMTPNSSWRSVSKFYPLSYFLIKKMVLITFFFS